MTGCRIGKVKMKNGGAEIRVFNNQPHVKNDEVTMLEDVLKAARKGDVVAVMIGFICSDGSSETGISPGCFDDVNRSFGVANRLAHLMSEELYDRR